MRPLPMLILVAPSMIFCGAKSRVKSATGNIRPESFNSLLLSVIVMND